MKGEIGRNTDETSEPDFLDNFENPMPTSSSIDQSGYSTVAVGLLRHSLAEKRDSEKFPDDSLRPLTRDGLKLARQVARGLKALGFKPDCIFTSPYARTRQTADCIAKVFRMASHQVIDAPELAEHAAVRASMPALVKQLRKARLTANRPIETLLLVGHQPFLGHWLAHALAGLSEAEAAKHDFHFAKCGFAWLTGQPLRAGRGRLTHMLPPSLLKGL